MLSVHGPWKRGELRLKATATLAASCRWLLAVVMAAGSAAAAPAPKAARLLSSTRSTISFEVVVPAARLTPAGDGTVRVLIDGFGTLSPAGAPEIPGKTFRIAIPPDGEARVSATALEEENLGPISVARVAGERLVEGENGMPLTETFMPPDPWVDGELPPLVSAGTPSFMGRARVLPVRVSPLSVGQPGEPARLARRIVVTVSFAAQRALPGDLGALPSLSTGAWKRLYGDLLVNPADAARFERPAPPLAAAAAPIEAGKRLKIRIPETGLYVIRADSLIAAGLSPGLAIGEIALRKRYYDASQPDLEREVDVPIFVANGAGGSDAVFDADDRLYFYALGLKDDAAAGDPDALYAGDNVLWLEEGVAGQLMGTAAPPPGMEGDPVAFFRRTIRMRTDTAYMKNAVPGTFDYYFFKGYDVRSYAIAFDAPAPAPSGTWSAVFRVQGGDGLGFPHTLSFSVRNGSGTNLLGSGGFTGKERKTFTFSSLPVSWLADGANEFVLVCDQDYKFLVNDITVEYPARFVAGGDMLEFGVDPLYDLGTIDVSGFSAARGFLFDVSNVAAPACRALGAAEFAADGSTWRLLLNLGENLSARRFVAIGPGGGTTLAARRVSVDTPSQLRATEGSYQALVVCHGNFLQRIGEWVDRRRGEGYRVFVANVEDVYDEFNGGLPHAAAIKRCIKSAFDRWGIEHVLLVGDSSEDHRRVNDGSRTGLSNSGPDYVPSRSYVTSVTGSYDDEVVVSDKWYAFLDGEPGPDAYPDVFVGRFSVGSDVELRAILNKIARIEDARVEDAWRRRVVLFSDDAWSGGGTDYRFRAYEREFEWSTDSCGVAIERSLPGGFEVPHMRLSTYTDPAHPDPEESGPAVFSRAREATRKNFTPALVRELNRGCLLHMFQGHANRSVLTTESAFSLQTYSDVDSLRSYLPFVFAGFGCHISDFAIVGELSYATYAGANGDCMSEQFLFKPGGGAAATYASDAFEYLSQNAELAERMFQSLFLAPPVDSVEPRNEYTGAHWILGEALTKAEIEQIDETVYGVDQIVRYHLLGDPLLRIDPGPPLLALDADWGGGFEPLDPDSLRARGGTNDVVLRLTASDVVAVGPVSLEVNGADWSDSLAVTPLKDAGETYPRAYEARLRYTIDPADELIAFAVATPDGREAGRLEVPIVKRLRLFYNGYLEILSGVPCPPTGTFTVRFDSPAYLAAPPRLSIDGIHQDDVHFRVADPLDSLRWEASFDRTLAAGTRVFTLTAGEFSRDIVFVVTGDDLAVEAFNFPNPFSGETNIVYSLNLAAEAGRIEIYNVSGIRIRSIPLTSERLRAASFISPHSIVWDGRDDAGDRVANGTYLYILHVERGGQGVDITGTSVKLE